MDMVRIAGCVCSVSLSWSSGPSKMSLESGEAEGVVGLLEDGAGGGDGVVEGAAHADDLGALAGEEEGELWILLWIVWGAALAVGHVSFSLDAAPPPRAFCAKSSRHEG